MANTTAAGQACVLPLSSPYSFLPRLQTYILVATLLLPLPRGWLFRAALAALTTRTAIFAVDSVVVLHTISSFPVGFAPAAAPAPLNALVVLESMALAAVAAAWLLLVSRRGGESAARGLVRAWAAIVAVGTVLSFVAVVRLGQRMAAGVPSSTSPQSANGTTTLCDGVWMGTDVVLGSPIQGVPVLGNIGWKVNWFVDRVGVPGLVSAALALVALALPRRAAESIGGAAVPLPLLPADLEGGALSDVPIRVESSEPFSGHRLAWRAVGLALKLGLLAMAVLVPVSAELYLLKLVSGLPSAEDMTSVAQWGGFVAMGVVALATFINAVRKKTGLKRAGLPAGVIQSPDVGDADSIVKI